ncbi:roadblock/LC7 domain-containing protein, partial [Streptomyces vinaceus]
MTAPSTYGLSTQARNLQWLLTDLVEEVPGVNSVAVVSSDGLLLLSSDPGGAAAAAAAPPPRESPPPPQGPPGATPDQAPNLTRHGRHTT